MSALFQRSSKLHVLRSVDSGQLLGFRTPEERQYLLGFASRSHAELVRACRTNGGSKLTTVTLTRGRPSNVAGDINASVRRMCRAIRSPPSVPSLTDLVIDVDAVVTVMRAAHEQLAMEEMPYADFLMLPVEHNIGIAMANDVLLATLADAPATVSFVSHVIDPADAVYLFRQLS
jgi:hypothetical protein